MTDRVALVVAYGKRPPLHIELPGAAGACTLLQLEQTLRVAYGLSAEGDIKLCLADSDEYWKPRLQPSTTLQAVGITSGSKLKMKTSRRGGDEGAAASALAAVTGSGG